MDDIQQEYRDQLTSIISRKGSKKTKTLLLQNLITTMREAQTPGSFPEQVRYKNNFDALSTSISECYSVNYTTEKDIEQLQQRIIKLRLVKFENNEEIETMQQELFQMQKVVTTRMEYHDFLKKQVDMKMLNIQRSDEKKEKGKQKIKEKSVLNKSLDAVAGALKISKWWL